MKYRLRWSKQGKLRFVSHHDEALIFERSARRAGLPLAYSKGFSPHPKISFGSGLPVGFASEVELLDVSLTENMEPGELIAAFNSGLPAGFEILAASELTSGSVSLGVAITAAAYEVHCEAPWLPDALQAFLSLPTYEIVRPYKGGTRRDDLRAGVLSAASSGDMTTFTCAIQPRSTRPSDVVDALAKIAGEPGPPAAYRRTALLTGPPDRLGVLDETSRIAKAAA